MRILLSNDDGINAPGLKILEEIARTLSDDVWIAAPELDQSGASHSLTLKDPLRVRELGPKRFAINGTPTDCVMLAVCHLMKNTQPDLVLSGVNYGANLAEDVIYSGTVAAAMEGALLDIPSIAMSLVHDDTLVANWDAVLAHAPSVLKNLLTKPWGPEVLININFPPVTQEHVKGVLITTQGERPLAEESFLKRTDPRGKPYYWVSTINHNATGTPDSDLQAVCDGYISITPLSFHLTHTPTVAILKEMFNTTSLQKKAL